MSNQVYSDSTHRGRDKAASEWGRDSAWPTSCPVCCCLQRRRPQAQGSLSRRATPSPPDVHNVTYVKPLYTHAHVETTRGWSKPEHVQHPSMREAGIGRVIHSGTTLSRGASPGLTENISVLRAQTHLLAVFELHPVLALPLLISDQSACTRKGW